MGQQQQQPVSDPPGRATAAAVAADAKARDGGSTGDAQAGSGQHAAIAEAQVQAMDDEELEHEDEGVDGSVQEDLLQGSLPLPDMGAGIAGEAAAAAAAAQGAGNEKLCILQVSTDRLGQSHLAGEYTARLLRPPAGPGLLGAPPPARALRCCLPDQLSLFRTRLLGPQMPACTPGWPTPYATATPTCAS